VKKLSFLNWSIKNTLSTLSDPVDKAILRVFYFVFLLNIPKVFFSFYDHIILQQTNFYFFDLLILVVTLVTLKLLLSKPEWIKPLIHLALSFTSLILIFSAFYKRIDLPVLQQIFMVITFSFYGLGRKWGIFYSLINIFSLFILLIYFGNTYNLHIPTYYAIPQVGYIAIVIINFLALIGSHYYFHSVFFSTLDEKRELNKKFKKIAKDKTNFLSTMSHELRTPLNAVIGISELLSTGKHDKDQEENLEILKFSAESLMHLINNILDFNKIESEKLEMEEIAFNLSDLLHKNHAVLKIKALEKGLNYTLSIDPEIDKIQVISDPTRLTQILFNLLGNAIKFTPNGSIKLAAQVLNKNTNSINIRISVSDTGIGIDSSKQKVIFKPFAQASKNTTRNYGGTGLGLAIAKHLTDQFNSEIQLTSELNKGTTFFFDINFKITEKSIPISDHENSIKPELNQLKVLLAEDNEMNILFMKKLLSKWNINTVDIATNGIEAVDLVEKNDYDVILMDIHMPHMDGFQATKKIRKLTDTKKSNIHIIVLTASVADEIVTVIKRYRINDYLCKPFPTEELKIKLENLVKSLSKK
jgi:signal transduction histidine kinase/CheY-like chemotaxis protein